MLGKCELYCGELLYRGEGQTVFFVSVSRSLSMIYRQVLSVIQYDTDYSFLSTFAARVDISSGSSTNHCVCIWNESEESTSAGSSFDSQTERSVVHKMGESHL